MSTQHTEGRVLFREDGEANRWAMLTEDCRWMLTILANGEQTTPRQVANFRRLAACWNACEGISTEALESKTGIFDAAAKLADQRDELLAALERVRATPQWVHTAIGIRAEIDAAIAKTTGSTS